jgi:hypothetical protein
VSHPGHFRIKQTEQKLTPALETLNPSTLQSIDDVGRVEVATPGSGMPELDFDQAPTFHRGSEVTANGLDFGQFGHGYNPIGAR